MGDAPEPLDPWDDDPLWAAVRKLPRRQAQAVVLVYVDDLSLERVAEILQCSVGSVKTHLHRARQRLAAELGQAPTAVPPPGPPAPPPRPERWAGRPSPPATPPPRGAPG